MTRKGGLKEFDKAYKTHTTKPITDLSNNFLQFKIVFNNISIEDAYYKGKVFFKEFEGLTELVEGNQQLRNSEENKSGV
jgi:ribosomal protein L21E